MLRMLRPCTAVDLGRTSWDGLTSGRHGFAFAGAKHAILERVIGTEPAERRRRVPWGAVASYTTIHAEFVDRKSQLRTRGCSKLSSWRPCLRLRCPGRESVVVADCGRSEDRCGGGHPGWRNRRATRRQTTGLTTSNWIGHFCSVDLSTTVKNVGSFSRHNLQLQIYIDLCLRQRRHAPSPGGPVPEFYNIWSSIQNPSHKRGKQLITQCPEFKQSLACLPLGVGTKKQLTWANPGWAAEAVHNIPFWPRSVAQRALGKGMGRTQFELEL